MGALHVQRMNLTLTLTLTLTPGFRAKNGENEREYHNVLDAVAGLGGRQIDTSKKGRWGCSTSNLNARA
jgi:hypothetical protein